ncbi:MAG: transglutaminase domain-containing protein [Anaerolineae bacterium]|nr:transglutaminase domain-containing protein [Anaerolineae bacterium]
MSTVSGGRLLTFILLAVMVLDVTWALGAAKWAEGLDILPWIALGGLFLGVAMAHTSWSGLFPWVHSLVTGTAWVGLLTGTLLTGELTVRERFYQLILRIATWTERAITGRASGDNLIFILQLAILMWWVGFVAAWAVYRQGKVWRAVIPPALVILVNIYYASQDLTGYFVLFLLSGLLLIVRTNLSRQERQWQSAQIKYDSDIGFDFLRDGVVFSVLVVALAYALPNATSSSGGLGSALETFRGPVHNVQMEWTRLFSSLNYQARGGVAVIGPTLNFGGPRNLGQAIVMDVESPAGRYWRGATFDNYTSRGWISTDREVGAVDPGKAFPVLDYSLRKLVTQTVTVYIPSGGLLFAAAQPVLAEIPIRVEYARLNAQSEESPATGDEQTLIEVSRLISKSRLREGQSYTVVSSLTEADPQSLRNAGNNYPQGIQERYLQLPTDLAQRVRDLAAEVTKGQINAYDKVAALETYLRGFQYNEKIPAPPAGRDGVEYFLFDIKQGYCDYYASSLVVMARSLGIPARIATGYAQGEYHAELGAYRVKEADAHSWPEVYFPQYGWVEFEPTAAQPNIVRPEAKDSSESEPSPADPTNPAFDFEQDFLEDLRDNLLGAPGATTLESLRRGWQTAVWSGAAIALLGIAALGISRWQRRRVLADPTLIEQLYEQLARWSNWLGMNWRPHYTPHENATVLVKAAPEAAAPVNRITGLYVQQRWSSQPPSQADAVVAANAWERLRPALLRRLVRARLRLPARLTNLWRRPRQ